MSAARAKPDIADHMAAISSLLNDKKLDPPAAILQLIDLLSQFGIFLQEKYPKADGIESLCKALAKGMKPNPFCDQPLPNLLLIAAVFDSSSDFTLNQGEKAAIVTNSIANAVKIGLNGFAELIDDPKNAGKDSAGLAMTLKGFGLKVDEPRFEKELGKVSSSSKLQIESLAGIARDALAKKIDNMKDTLTTSLNNAQDRLVVANLVNAFNHLIIGKLDSETFTTMLVKASMKKMLHHGEVREELISPLFEWLQQNKVIKMGADDYKKMKASTFCMYYCRLLLRGIELIRQQAHQEKDDWGLVDKGNAAGAAITVTHDPKEQTDHLPKREREILEQLKGSVMDEKDIERRTKALTGEVTAEEDMKIMLVDYADSYIKDHKHNADSFELINQLHPHIIIRPKGISPSSPLSHPIGDQVLLYVAKNYPDYVKHIRDECFKDLAKKDDKKGKHHFVGSVLLLLKMNEYKKVRELLPTLDPEKKEISIKDIEANYDHLAKPEAKEGAAASPKAGK